MIGSKRVLGGKSKVEGRTCGEDGGIWKYRMTMTGSRPSDEWTGEVIVLGGEDGINVVISNSSARSGRPVSEEVNGSKAQDLVAQVASVESEACPGGTHGAQARTLVW